MKEVIFALFEMYIIKASIVSDRGSFNDIIRNLLMYITNHNNFQDYLYLN